MTPFGRRNRIHYYSSATRNLWNYNTVACNYTHANYQLPRMTTEEWQATCIDVFRRTETPRGSKQAGRDNDGHGLLTTRSNRFRRSVAAGTDAATTATTANCCCSCWTRSDCTLQSPRQIIRPIVAYARSTVCLRPVVVISHRSFSSFDRHSAPRSICFSV